MKGDPSLVFDGFSSLAGGMNSNVGPSEIAANQYAYGENVTVRGGFPKDRPPFQVQEWWNGLTLEPYVWMRDAVYQGVSYYGWLGQEFIISAVGGRIFETRLTTPIPTTREITPPGGGNTQKLNKVWFCQAQQYLVIQDGINTPIIYNGNMCRRAAATEVPCGTIMAFGLGRLWLVVGGNRIVAGDILGGPTSVISFTENTYLAEGGYFTVPIQANEVTAMGFSSVGNTQTGQGPLLVFTNTSISSINGLIPRAQWKDTQIQQIAVLDTGAASDRSIVGINGDVWMRSQDGVRSYIAAVRQQGAWQHAPLSNEMRRVIQHDPSLLLNFASTAYFDQRFLCTYGPHLQGITVVHEGLIALNFDVVSMISGASPPVWEGVWTGVKPHQLVTGLFNKQQRCFMVCRSEDNYNRLWEIQKTGFYDNACQPIKSRIETKAFSWTDRLGVKKLKTGTLTVSGIQNEVLFDIKHRPDYYPCFLDWASFSRTNTLKTCEVTNCTVPNNQEGYDPTLYLNAPPRGCNDQTNKPTELGSLHQAQITWTGPAVINVGRFEIYPQYEPVYGACPADDDPAKKVDCCPDVVTKYVINECIVDPPMPPPIFLVDPGINSYVTRIAYSFSEKKVIAVGQFYLKNPSTSLFNIAKFNLDGSLDSAFDISAGFDNPTAAVAPIVGSGLIVDGNGNIFASVSLKSFRGHSLNQNTLFRITPQGAFQWVTTGIIGQIKDAVSTQHGNLILGSVVTSLINPCGAMIIDPTLGIRDASFNLALQGNDPQSACQLSNGQIAIVGAGTNAQWNMVAIVYSNGTIDTSFANPNPSTTFGGLPTRVIQLNSGILLITGSFNTALSSSCNGMATFNLSGALDTATFPKVKSLLDPSEFGSVDYCVSRMVKQSSGKIILAGYFTTLGGQSHIGIGRLNPDGSLDSTFSSGGFEGGSPITFVSDICLDENENIYCGGNFTSYNGTARNFICKLDPNGRLI